MTIPVKTEFGVYDVVIGHGLLCNANKLLNLNRKVLVVTDDGVPEVFPQSIANQSLESLVLVIPQGEKSKNIDNYKRILEALLGADFTRSDCIVAVGGGVVGDMAGFAAATYMRGIDFYNIPTTVLSQVDSSIGGKTAIDFGGFKNTIGAFYPPKAVMVDFDTLKTLDSRQISNGLAESLKMAATCDSELFGVFERGQALSELEKVITASIGIKKRIVEADEREAGLRSLLNFGHTLGHAIESVQTGLLHGECIGIGMLYMCSTQVKERIGRALKLLNLPVDTNIEFECIRSAILHDKKTSGDEIKMVYVENIGSYEFISEKTDAFLEKTERIWQK
ncbi:MAG: 3-dehydroquinate synthase [Clostridia bacterium]|nr:3-dehydroquinate synthase [Clostridia bacterium]